MVPIRSQGERQEKPEQVADMWNYWGFGIDILPGLKLK